MLSFGKLVASHRSVHMMAKSIASQQLTGSLSTAAATAPITAASKKPSRSGDDHFSRFVLPTTILPTISNAPFKKMTENGVLRTALQDLQRRQNEEIGNIERMLDSLRIARLPTNNSTTSTTETTKGSAHQHRTFQIMNRNARKPKRANHGKRPCSRIKRRYQVKKWQNTSRRG